MNSKNKQINQVCCDQLNKYLWQSIDWPLLLAIAVPFANWAQALLWIQVWIQEDKYKKIVWIRVGTKWFK